MANGMDKYRSRRNRNTIRELFWREWDPIGINDCEAAKDEYDRYADKAYVMLMFEERTSDDIASYLYDISSCHMGLGEGQALKSLAEELAKKLMRLRPVLEAESNDPF